MEQSALTSYPDALAALATLGMPTQHGDRTSWPDYLAMGLTLSDTDDLIRMVEDPVLNTLPGEDPAVWAPLHAARVLGQLGAVEMAPRLLRLIPQYPSDDYLHEEMAHIMAALGPGAVPALAEFISDQTVDTFSRNYAIGGLEQIGKEYPDAKDKCAEVLERMLAGFEQNDEILNAFLVGSLATLKATQSIATIRAAFAADAVDISGYGDLEDVEIIMGIRLFRDTERALFGWSRYTNDNDMLNALDGGKYDVEPAQNPYRNIGRNDPCPCGSGKKFKKCCLGTL